MDQLDLMRQLHLKQGGRMVLLVLDGLGGLPLEAGGPTELEAAATPELDRLASQGCLGQIIPVRHGIAPGSGPAHLALFGYDPIAHQVGRGVLEASGIGLEVEPGDVAARGNFCTLDRQGRITDRRAGRISSEVGMRLVDQLKAIEIPDAQFSVEHVREYRFALRCRGSGLHPDIADTDPQITGAAPLDAIAADHQSEKTARLFNQWIAEAREMLAGEPVANGLTLRGFSTNPQLPSYAEVYGLKAACSAEYPMYKGVARLVGMQVPGLPASNPQVQFQALADVWEQYDFFFVHVKPTDSRGEDGDFEGKAKVIEGVDAALPALLQLQPEALAITGDHSTPAKMRMHSWHPVPLLLWAPKTIRPDAQISFGETACAQGGLGTLPASAVMPLLMAHAGRLIKFGA